MSECRGDPDGAVAARRRQHKSGAVCGRRASAMRRRSPKAFASLRQIAIDGSIGMKFIPDPLSENATVCLRRVLVFSIRIFCRESRKAQRAADSAHYYIFRCCCRSLVCRSILSGGKCQKLEDAPPHLPTYQSSRGRAPLSKVDYVYVRVSPTRDPGSKHRLQNFLSGVVTQLVAWMKNRCGRA